MLNILTDTRRTHGGHTADTSTDPSTDPVKIHNRHMRALKNLIVINILFIAFAILSVIHRGSRGSVEGQSSISGGAVEHQSCTWRRRLMLVTWPLALNPEKIVP